ncbi:MAG: hypothetical protein IPO95_07535 [Rhodanobacteraceae bacterium]|nr:hypothetical protein [Rhodanobacteraceae bacterium]
MLRDHRAFAHSATTHGLQRIAVPVVVHDGASGSAPWMYQPWLQTGVVTFDVGPTGEISGYRLRTAVAGGSGNRHTDARSVLLGDSVFLFSGGRWYGQRIDSVATMSGPY